MKTTDAIKQAEQIYKELAGSAGSLNELPTQAEKVMAIIEVAEFLIKRAG